jgi:protein-S-isoprenylcysteine O-methyltransferase Ste14
MIVGLVWEILIWGWIGLEIVISIATRTRRSKGVVHDRGSHLVLWAAITGAFFAAGSIEGPHWTIPLNHLALRIAALILVVTGLVIRIVAIWTLGRAFSANVAIRSDQKLLRSGLYGIVRHPSYLGMEVIFVAAGLWTHNWISLAIMIVLPTVAVLYRIHVEEIALRSAFGNEYTEYSAATKRLVPGLY